MILRKIHLKNFRNFSETKFDLNPFLTIILGENASGKTNLLEGIYTLLNGTGFRESREEELIHFGETLSFIEGKFNLGDEIYIFKINLIKKNTLTEKTFFVGKTRKKLNQYLKEQTRGILFSPELINLISGPPAERRDYINKIISSYDFEYKRRLVNYENALKKRNKILEKYLDEEKLKEELEFWNNYLLDQAFYITKKRQSYIDYLNQNQKLDAKEFTIEYIKNELTKQRLTEIFSQEKKWRRTLIGPQKDDFQIYLMNSPDSELSVGKKNIHHFGSRSEQRMAIFWLLINEIKYFEEKMKKKPILLLDDIFSELDSHNQKIILNLIKKYQTIITTTEIEVLKLIDIPKSLIVLKKNS